MESFVQIYTSANKKNPLEMSPDHVIVVDSKSDHPIRAATVQVGDVLNGETKMEVTKIGTVPRKGVYAPPTPSGTIVVNGVVSSSYISLQNSAKEYV